MRLVELIFERADGTKFSVPFDEARTLQDLLGHMPDISQPKEEKPQKADTQDILDLFQKQPRLPERKDWPPNWPPAPPWGPATAPGLGFYRVTCEQQPLRFEWGAIKDNKITGTASQTCKIIHNAPAS